MIRILQCVNDMHRAGLETMLMNYYRNIDRTKIQFDFLTHRPYKSDYDDEIESLGGRVYYAPRLYPQNYPIYFKWMKHFFEEHSEYQIMHSHIDAMSYIPLLAGKKCGIPIRIAHSHNTSIDKDFKWILKQYYRKRVCSAATNFLACGEEAGKFLFNNKEFKVIPNAIEIEKFSYNDEVRTKKRKELGINNEFIIGHVGRFSYAKNHKFLIDTFSEVLKINSSAILLIIGTGDKFNEIKRYVSHLNLTNNVQFLGNRSDVSELYQAMDAFVLPSLFEGVPLVGIEAQFSDLPCIFSDKVPVEVSFSKNAQFLSLNSSAKEWAEKILSCSITNRNSYRNDIIDSPYNIKIAHNILEDYYLNLLDSLS